MVTYRAFRSLPARKILLGCSLMALTMAMGGSLRAQDNFDLGVPVDGSAPVAAPVVTDPTPPAVEPVPADAPSVPAPATAPMAGEVVPVPAATPVEAAAAPAVAQPVAEPVAEPAGDTLAVPGASPSADVQVVSPAAALPAPEAEKAEAAPAADPAKAGITKEQAAFEEDLFYDANDIVPEGEIGKRSARKVNPRLEPGSKLIVVTQDSGPGSRDAQLVSANRALKLGRYEAALEIYQTLYEKNRKDPRVLMGVAVALQRMGNFDASIAAYQELLDIQPKNVEAEINMLGLMSEKYPAVALRRLEEMRKEKPSELGVVAQLAVTQAQLNNTQEALKYLAVAASMQPQNPGHVFNMAIIADRAGNRKEAVRFYEQALEMDSIYGGGRGLPRDIIFERLARLR